MCYYTFILSIFGNGVNCFLSLFGSLGEKFKGTLHGKTFKRDYTDLHGFVGFGGEN